MAMQDFLGKCNLCQLVEKESAQLNFEIFVQGVKKAIISLKSTKPQAPMDFQVSCKNYETLRCTLKPTLMVSYLLP